MTKKVLTLFLLAVVLLTTGFGCKVTDKETEEAMKPITLVYWRVFDGQDAFDEIIEKYRALHPFVNIEYRKLRFEEYETELINALAEDRGPDIFSIHNTWVKKYQPKLAPLPESTTMAYPIIKGSLKKEIIPELRTTPSISLKYLKDNFVETVNYDVVLEDGLIYGLPLSVDTLAMYYNLDLFNNAGISQAPQYWDKDFLQAVKKLTKQDDKGDIIQAGVALGGGKNINRFSDILSVLMMQNGATMLDGNQVRFHSLPPENRQSDYNPGLEALRFYTDFANATKESYTWNSSLNNSLEMFMSGNLAIMFSYSYDLPTIKAQAPKLNFSVAKLPQIEGNPPTSINFANYWVEVVSKKSQNQNEAWDFLQFITKGEQAKTYLSKTNRPTALRSLVPEQRNSDEIGVFADQVLTAKSWYKGKNIQAAESAIGQMIEDAVLNSGERLQDYINNTAAKVQQTIN